MKINNETHFPHPVLSSLTGDYKTGNFSFSLIVDESPRTGKVKLIYRASLDEMGLTYELSKGNTAFGIAVSCLETFYNRIIPLQELEGVYEFPVGQLKGRVSIRPLLWAHINIEGYKNENLHDEFGNASWDLQIGSLLAIAKEIIINVGNDKLARMETIFKLAVNNDIPEGEIRVQVDGDYIVIVSASDTCGVIAGLREVNGGPSLLLNSIYLPVVMEVLSHLRDGVSAFSDKKWYRVFNAKCEHLGIEYASTSFLEDAQKLLKSPISQIKTIGQHLV